MKRCFATACAMLAILGSVLLPPSYRATAETPASATIEIDATRAVGDIADGLGTASIDDPNVTCDDTTRANPLCARLALRMAQAAANAAFLPGAARKEIKFAVQVGSGVAGLFGGEEEPASFSEAVLRKAAEAVADAIKEWALHNPLADDVKSTVQVQGCGEVRLEWKLLGPAAPNGPPRLEMVISGNCHCAYIVKGGGQGRLGAFTVTATGDIKADPPLSAWRAKFKQLVAKHLEIDLPWTPRLEHLRYDVFARCDDCDHETTGQPPIPPVTPSPQISPAPGETVVDRICYQKCKAEYEAWITWKTALEKKEADAADPALMSDPATAAAVRRSLEIDKAHEAEARRAYYECAKKCYDAAVATHEIPDVPVEIQKLKPTPAPTLQPIDRDPNVKPFQPVPGAAGSAKNISLPPWSGSNGVLVINVNPNEEPEGGASGVVMITEDQQGNKKLLEGHGAAGRLVLLAGLGLGTLRAIQLVTGFDEHGNPIGGSRCQIGEPPHIEGTQPVAQTPPNGLAIKEAGSSVEPGDAMTLHLQGNDPLTTRFTLDGQPVTALGVSNNSALVRFDQTTTLMHHQLVLHSGDQQTTPLSIAVVRLTPHAPAVSHPGAVQTVTIDVAGLTADDRATMYFELLGDAASIVNGGTNATVPVTGGEAHVQIIGRHAGAINLRYRLVVSNPQFIAGQ